MLKEIVKKFTIWCAVFCQIFQTASTSNLPSTDMTQCGFQSAYTLHTRCSCDDRYRTLDGSCNNKFKQIKGRSFTPFKRYLGSHYEDGLGTPYTNRPSPRNLSLFLFKANTNESLDAKVNDWFVTFGQFLIHDLAFAASNNGSISCCPVPTHSDECMPIVIESGDEFLMRNITCVNFVRNLGVGPITGKRGSREQLNIISHYMDGSMVYGSSEKELDHLRDCTTGKMKLTHIGNNTLLPIKKEAKVREHCPFFDAGDIRVNENVNLAMQHVIWAREHNLILDKLSKINPEWSVKTLFEEARRIIVAEIQFITYKEFLPLLIGGDYINRFSLDIQQHVGSYEYSTDATISNAFTTAVFRYGHAMVSEFIEWKQTNFGGAEINTTGVCSSGLKSFSCNSTQAFTLAETLFKTDILYSCQNSIDAVAKGSIELLAQKANDMNVATELTARLSRLHDLISVNIQRGRDHGLPVYNAWRAWCGLDSVDLQSNPTSHTRTVFNKLKSIYVHADDIDLFVGGLLEENLDGAVLGPTFACICARQFVDIKFGDRYWYQFSQFTSEQINEIHNQSMSKIIMRNSNVQSLPMNAFAVPAADNPRITQAESDFDITPWKNV